MRTLNRTHLSTKFTLGVMSISIFILAAFHQTYDFNDKNPGPEVLIIISDGSTGVAIGKLLMDSGVIKDSKFFVNYYLTNPAARAIAPGIHKVETHISTKLAVSQLLDQKRITNSIKILEGTTFSDVLTTLKNSKEIIFTKPDLQTLKAPIANRLNSLEGQIFPAIYSFEPGTSSDAALTSMLKRFENSIKENKLSSFGKFSKYEVLTIASLIQVEGDLSDYPKVARTIYNRLKISMPLQLNSTVQYAANLRGRIALSTAATKILSPYNTYRNIGLPPTPISNPSSAAIRAAMNPAKGDWLYFITIKPGDTRFTKDYNEFQSWSEIYNKNLANGLFK